LFVCITVTDAGDCKLVRTGAVEYVIFTSADLECLLLGECSAVIADCGKNQVMVAFEVFQSPAA